MEALKLAQQPASPVQDSTGTDKTEYSEVDSDASYNPNVTTITASTAASHGAPKSILKKKGKPKLTNKEKKERGLAIERIVTTLPLEFRGSDPNLRRHIETVIEGLLDREGRGVAREFLLYAPHATSSLRRFTVPELVKPPDLNQARVNKCMIALVHRKIVRKENSTVRTTSQLVVPKY